MGEAKKRRWLVISFFLVIGLLFCGFIYTAVTGPRYWQNRQRLERTVVQQDISASDQKDETNITLTTGQMKSVGNIKLIYKGLDGKKIYIDVIIPQFDPEMAHRHIINQTDAKNTLKLGGQDFVLISARASRLHLKKVK
jgi:hypothetical protein